MEFISEANFDVHALRGGKWSMVRIDAEGPVDGQGKALANLLASGNEAGFWQEALRHLEAAEVLEPFAFDLVVETGRSLPMEAVRLPPEQDGGTTFLIREAERQRTVLGAAARAQALIELSYEGFTVFDAQATILYESASNARITGYPQDECVGRSLFDFIHPEDAARLVPRFARLAEQPGEMDSDTVRWLHRDGHWIYLEGTVVNQLEDPNIRGMINTFHDVTARVEMERALTAAKDVAEAFQAKQQRFLAMLSHELRTPLSLIKQPLEELLPAMGDDSDPRWGMVARGLFRMESLVEELVDFTVMDSGRARLKVREVAVANFLKEWLMEFQPLAIAKELKLLLAEETPELCAYFDPPKFGKVVSNILGNAIKFAPRGTKIVVSVRKVMGVGEASVLELAVEDEGTPIPAEERGLIFERYYQRDSGDDRAWEGMGLGLSLASEIVVLHGGEIGLRVGENTGNCFWVRLPLGVDHIALEEIALDGEKRPAPPLPLKIYQSSPTPVDFEVAEATQREEAGARVLIVEDHPDLRRFLGRQLEFIYDLQFAEDGAAALPMILRNPPELVLSDVMMPNLNGIRLCQKVREHFSARDLPIVLLSAKGQKDDRLAGLEAGANDYLSKPFSMDELRLRMHALLSARQSEATEPSTWPRQVRAALADLMGRGPFGASELADALGMSPRQLQRRCAAAFGQTPGQLIEELRLRHARTLLETGAVESVAAAAAAVGLSASYFSLRFRVSFNQTAKSFLAVKSPPSSGAST